MTFLISPPIAAHCTGLDTDPSDNFRGAGVGHGVVGPPVDLLVFDAAPQPLDEHVVPPVRPKVRDFHTAWVRCRKSH